MKRQHHAKWAAVALLIFMFAGLSVILSACSEEAENPVNAGAGNELTVMDFSKPFSLDPPPSGWQHRKFWFRPAMKVSFAKKDEVPALRCETNGGGSIFGRQVDVSLDKLSILAWDWYVEVPIESALDERTKEGDDHPARLFLRFQDGNNEDHAVEIIWSNKYFAPGEYKYIGDFPHYVANGHKENVGRWHSEQVNLLEIYRTTTKRKDIPKVKLIAIFCDSDDTGGHSVAYFSNVRLQKARSNSSQ